MRTVTLGEHEITVQGGPWAVSLYKSLFNEDFYNAYESAIITDDNGILSRVDPMFLLQIVYAMWKCANDADSETPKAPKSYDDFLKSLSDIPMPATPPWTWEVVSAIAAELFHFDFDAVVSETEKLIGDGDAEGRTDRRKNAGRSKKAGVQSK